MPSTIKALTAAVMKLLRPLVRMLQRNGVPYSVFADLAKRAYVDVAMEQFAIPGRKQSIARVSILTGLTRKEVMRIRDLAPAADDAGALARYNRAARVIAGWVRDPVFSPTLPLQGAGASFAELVRRYSGDMPARAMLDELQRVGAVAVADDGQVQLLKRAYVPNSGESEKLAILGTDVADLVSTIDHNIHARANGLRFQRKVAYDNLPDDAVPQLRAESGARAQGLLEELDRLFSHADRDVNPAVTGTGRRRAGVGIYYFEESVPAP